MSVNFFTETMCVFKTSVMFYICRTIERSEFRISAKFRLESINNDTWNSSLEKKIVYETETEEEGDDKKYKMVVRTRERELK